MQHHFEKTITQETAAMPEIAIHTRTPESLLPKEARYRRLCDELEKYHVAIIRNSLEYLGGITVGNKKKAQLIKDLAALLTFEKEADFKSWISVKPPLTKRLLIAGAFSGYCALQPLEEELRMRLVADDLHDSLSGEGRFERNVRLDFLSVKHTYHAPIAELPEFLQEVLRLWLVPPYPDPASCRLQERNEQTLLSYDNSKAIMAALPLFIYEMQQLFPDIEQALLDPKYEGGAEKLLSVGVKKRDLAKMLEVSLFEQFPGNVKMRPDVCSLALRFLLCITDGKPVRPTDVPRFLRDMTQAFFAPESCFPQRWNPPDRALLEYTLCLDHFTKPKHAPLTNAGALPPSRSLLLDLLLGIADGAWYDADKLFAYLHGKYGEIAVFNSPKVEAALQYKAEALILDGCELRDKQWETFYPVGFLRRYLLTRPLFKAYWYLFAAFGLLEIRVSEPPLARRAAGGETPLSPYDSLAALRVTDLGRYCLGLIEEAPLAARPKSRALVDEELFLVALEGESPEKRSYLDKVGERLGQERWRVGFESFLAGVTARTQLVERIERFHEIIDAHPAQHWEDFFQTMLDRGGSFDQGRDDFLLFELPPDRALGEELLRDPELKKIAYRVEGRQLAVRRSDMRLFYNALQRHGIAHFTPAKRP